MKREAPATRASNLLSTAWVHHRNIANSSKGTTTLHSLKEALKSEI